VSGVSVKKLIDENPQYYNVQDNSELYAGAQVRLEEQGLERLHDTLVKTGNTNPEVVAMQVLAIQAYGSMADQAMSKGDTQTAMEIMDLADEVYRAFSADATTRGQANAAIAHMQYMAPYMDTYVRTRADKLKQKILDQRTGGTTRKQKAQAAAKEVNQAKKANADAIADEAITDTSTKGMKPDANRESIKKKKAEALAEFRRLRGPGLQSGVNPLALIPLTKYGYYAMLDGALTFSDWVKKMKADTGVDDDGVLQSIWDSEFEGRKIGEVADATLRQQAASTVAKGLEAEPKVKSDAAKAKEEFRKQIRDAVAKHLKDPDGRPLTSLLVEDVGLSFDDALKVKDAVSKATTEKIGRIVGKSAKSVTSKAKKSTVERITDKLVDKDMNTDDMAGELSDELGFPADLSPDQAKRLKQKAMALRQVGVESKVGQAVLWEFAKEADSALKEIARSKTFLGNVFNTRNAQIYNSLVYAAMLNGIPTHAKNFLSVTAPAILSLGIGPALNPAKWAKAAYNAKQFKGTAQEKRMVFYFTSPIHEIMMRYRHGAESTKAAWENFVDSISTGQGIHRWEDEKKMNGEALKHLINTVPILERTRFVGGKFNPYNHIFGKMVGRALTSTDALTSTYFENQELAVAVLGEGVKAGLSIKEIEANYGHLMENTSQAWKDAMDDAQRKAEIASAFGIQVSASTIKASARKSMQNALAADFNISKEKQEDIGESHLTGYSPTSVKVSSGR